MAVALYGVGRVQPASMDRLEEEIEELPESCWTSVRTIGMGCERRAITRHQSHVTALWLDDVAVHVNLVSRE
jgi:hypothetical protein